MVADLTPGPAAGIELLDVLLCAVVFMILARRRLGVPEQRTASNKYPDQGRDAR